MMNDNMKTTNELLKGIQYLIREEIKKAHVDKTMTAIITRLNENNLYDISVGSTTFSNVPSIFNNLKLYDTVKVKIPQNQYSQMYIEGKYNLTVGSSESGGTETNVSWSDIIGIPNNIVYDTNYVHTDNNFTDSYKQKVDNSLIKTEQVLTKEEQEQIKTNLNVFNGDYENLTNKPIIPDKTSDLTNDSGYITNNDLISKGYLTEEVDPTVGQHIKNITEKDILNWNNKSNFSGNYEDLSGKPTIPNKTSELENDSNFISDNSYVHTDNNFTNEYKNQIETNKTNINNIDNSVVKYIPQELTTEQKNQAKNNLEIFNGDYNNLQNKPTIPSVTSDLINDSGFISDNNYVHTDNNFTTIEKNKLSNIQDGAEKNVQADWNETDSLSDSYIKNKPIIPEGVEVIDNLTSQSSTSSLSANQGRVLKNILDTNVIISKTMPTDQQIGSTWYQEID